VLIVEMIVKFHLSLMAPDQCIVVIAIQNVDQQDVDTEAKEHNLIFPNVLLF
jgi:hypothetical protein